MSLWTDKFRPLEIEELPIDEPSKTRLKKLASSEDVPHLLIHGPPGSGKTSCIRAFLRKLYDSNISKLKIDERAFQSPSGRKVEITVYSSNHHVELNPSEAGIFDRVVVQEIIKEFAQTQQLDRAKKLFKTAVIFDADLLSKDAQHALRRTMEKYCANVRLILCCESASRIIAPIKSRCFILRNGAPSLSTIKGIVESVVRNEKANIPDSSIERICLESDGNLRSALLSSEILCTTKSKELVDAQKIFREMMITLLNDQSAACLLGLRVKLYDLLSRGLSQNYILQGLSSEAISSQSRPEVVSSILEYSSLFVTPHKWISVLTLKDHRMGNSTKPILHLEAFLATLMRTLQVKQQAAGQATMGS